MVHFLPDSLTPHPAVIVEFTGEQPDVANLRVLISPNDPGNGDFTAEERALGTAWRQDVRHGEPGQAGWWSLLP
jgi:hypothetical protein